MYAEASTQPPRDGKSLIVVLGMHRSGTSAVAACLHDMGFWLGREEDLLGATPENARGYWELRALVELNDALLAALGCTWDSPTLPPLASIGAARLAEFTGRAQELLQSAFGDAPTLVLKDPRLCRLLDFWMPQFESVGAQVRYVLALRDPLECAASIHRRDRLASSMARWLWADHIAWACVQTAGRQRLVVAYERLLTDPRQELERLALFAGVAPEVVDAKVLAGVEPTLRHHIRLPQRLSAPDEHNAAPAGLQGSDDALQQIDERLYRALLPLCKLPAGEDDAALGDWRSPCREMQQLRAGCHHTALDVLPRGGLATVKTAGVLHLFYAEQWPQFLALWERMWPDMDLFVTVSGPEAERAKALVNAAVPSARVFEVDNRGRDLAAFMYVLPVLLHEGYVCCCKLHTKRSAYSDIDGQGWRLDLWQGLLASGESTERLRARFGTDEKLGLLGLGDYWVSVQEYRDSRHERVVELARRLLPGSSEDDWHFFAGTMFWFRPEALRPLLDLGLGFDAFEPEQGQREGTLAHSIERVVALAARASGHAVDVYTASKRQNGLPIAFARSTAEQLLDELRQIRERLNVVEVALGQAQSLALERLAQLERLDSALSQTQQLALDRGQIIASFQRSMLGKMYKLLHRVHQ